MKYLNPISFALWKEESTYGVSLVAQRLKCLPGMQETRVRSLGQEDSLEKEVATHSSVLAWKNPMDRGVSWAVVHRVTRIQHDLMTKPPPPNFRGKAKIM